THSRGSDCPRSRLTQPQRAFQDHGSFCDLARSHIAFLGRVCLAGAGASARAAAALSKQLYLAFQDTGSFCDLAMSQYALLVWAALLWLTRFGADETSAKAAVATSSFFMMFPPRPALLIVRDDLTSSTGVTSSGTKSMCGISPHCCRLVIFITRLRMEICVQIRGFFARVSRRKRLQSQR